MSLPFDLLLYTEYITVGRTLVGLPPTSYFMRNQTMCVLIINDSEVDTLTTEIIKSTFK